MTTPKTVDLQNFAFDFHRPVHLPYPVPPPEPHPYPGETRSEFIKHEVTELIEHHHFNVTQVEFMEHEYHFHYTNAQILFFEEDYGLRI